jgi:hypothetical protein
MTGHFADLIDAETRANVRDNALLYQRGRQIGHARIRLANALDALNAGMSDHAKRELAAAIDVLEARTTGEG